MQGGLLRPLCGQGTRPTPGTCTHSVALRRKQSSEMPGPADGRSALVRQLGVSVGTRSGSHADSRGAPSLPC